MVSRQRIDSKDDWRGTNRMKRFHMMKLVDWGAKKFDLLWHEASEKRKIKDPRRQAIVSTVTLTQEQKEAIDRFYLQHYGKKIPYTWHRLYQAFTGTFDQAYMPELLFIPRIEKLMNPKQYLSTLSDKNLFANLLRAAGQLGIPLSSPVNYVTRVNGILRDEKERFIGEEQAIHRLNEAKDVFIKPSVGSSSGRNCMLLSVENGVDTRSGRSLREIFEIVGPHFVAQQVIRSSDALRRLNPSSVNTFRIVTYILHGQVYHMPGILRIGRAGKAVDNAHAGGIFIGVTDEGVFCDRAYTEFCDHFDKHPDTGVAFKGYTIDGYPQMLDTFKALHRMVPQLGMVSWDATIDENRQTVVVEANVTGQAIWIMQMAHGKSGFGENTGAILEMIRADR